MNNTGAILEELAAIARKDPNLRQRFLDSRESEQPYREFCRIAQSLGYDLSVMDLLDAEDQFLGLLEKSVNGGGANHSVLQGSDDFYAQFFNEINGDEVR